MTLREALDEARLYARVERAIQFVWRFPSERSYGTGPAVDTHTSANAVIIYHVTVDGRVTRLKG